MRMLSMRACRAHRLRDCASSLRQLTNTASQFLLTDGLDEACCKSMSQPFGKCGAMLLPACTVHEVSEECQRQCLLTHRY